MNVLLDKNSAQVIWDEVKNHVKEKATIGTQLVAQDICALDEGIYWADNNNSCSNKPSNVTAFSLRVTKTGNNNKHLELISGAHKAAVSNGDTYVRDLNEGTWSSWTKVGVAADHVVYSVSRENQSIEGSVAIKKTTSADKFIAGSGSDTITIGDEDEEGNKVISSHRTLRMIPGGSGTIHEGDFYADNFHPGGYGSSAKLNSTGFYTDGNEKHVYNGAGNTLTLGVDWKVKDVVEDLACVPIETVPFDGKSNDGWYVTEQSSYYQVENFTLYKFSESHTAINPNFTIFVSQNISWKNTEPKGINNGGAGNRPISINSNYEFNTLAVYLTGVEADSIDLILPTYVPANNYKSVINCGGYDRLVIFDIKYLYDNGIISNLNRIDFMQPRATTITKIQTGSGTTTALYLQGFNGEKKLLESSVVKTDDGKEGLVCVRGNTLSSYWAKVATLYTGHSGDIETLTLLCRNDTTDSIAILDLKLINSTSGEVTPYLNCLIGNFDLSKFRAYYKSNSKYCELWYNLGGKYNYLKTSVLSTSCRMIKGHQSYKLYNEEITSAQTPVFTNYIGATYATTFNKVSANEVITNKLSGNAGNILNQLNTRLPATNYDIDKDFNITENAQTDVVTFKYDFPFDLFDELCVIRLTLSDSTTAKANTTVCYQFFVPSFDIISENINQSDLTPKLVPLIDNASITVELKYVENINFDPICSFTLKSDQYDTIDYAFIQKQLM